MSLISWIKNSRFARKKYIPIWASLLCGGVFGRFLYEFNESIPGSIAIGFMISGAVYLFIFSLDFFNNDEGYM